MTASDIQCRLEAYLELRRSLGFVVRYETYALKELLQFWLPKQSCCWTTICDWNGPSNAARHCSSL